MGLEAVPLTRFQPHQQRGYIVVAITRSHLFAHELERLVEIEIERMKDNVALGFIENFSDYKYVTGKIAGLRSVKELMIEASAICDGKSREG